MSANGASFFRRSWETLACVLLSFSNVRKVLEDGMEVVWEEEDIMGDFPPCLYSLERAHLVLFRGFQTKLALCDVKPFRKWGWT